jgi:hypothetical protein
MAASMPRRGPGARPARLEPFSRPLPAVEVRIPGALAEQAVAAWERRGNEVPLDPESYKQCVQRHRAGDT